MRIHKQDMLKTAPGYVVNPTGGFILVLCRESPPAPCPPVPGMVHEGLHGGRGKAAAAVGAYWGAERKTKVPEMTAMVMNALVQLLPLRCPCHALTPPSTPRLPVSLSLPRVSPSPPLGFQEALTSVYKAEGEQVEFSFPLNFDNEDLSGQLMWQAEGASSTQSWVAFSLKDKKVSVQEVLPDLKLQMHKELPLRLSLPNISPHSAGSGTLSLTLANGKLQQQVNLVVMRSKEPGLGGRTGAGQGEWPSPERGCLSTLQVKGT